MANNIVPRLVIPESPVQEDVFLDGSHFFIRILTEWLRGELAHDGRPGQKNKKGSENRSNFLAVPPGRFAGA